MESSAERPTVHAVAATVPPARDRHGRRGVPAHRRRGVVRLTGSGLGCDDWPNCNNERFIDVSSGHAAIEQINRLLSGLIGIPTLLMAIGAFRVRPRRRGLTGAVARSSSLTILGNGVVGGIAVRGDLHPSLVQSHFVLAMLSIGFGLVAVHRAGPEPVGRRTDIGITPLVTGAVRRRWACSSLRPWSPAPS